LEKEDIIQLYARHKNVIRLSRALDYTPDNQKATHFQLKNLVGSATGLSLAACYSIKATPVIVVLPDKEIAAYFFNDLINLIDKQKVVFFPASYRRLAQTEQVESLNLIDRTDVLRRFNLEPLIVVTYPDALSEKVMPPDKVDSYTLILKRGEDIAINDIVVFLADYEFQRVDFVYEPGQYAVRGGIVDIFSYANEYPYRLDFFGNEIESIRTFNIESQLSIETKEQIAIIPDIQTKHIDDGRISLLQYIPTETVIWLKDARICADRIETVFNRTNELETTTDVSTRLVTRKFFEDALQNFTTVEFGQALPLFGRIQPIEFQTTTQPNFNKDLERLGLDIIEKTYEAFNIYVFSDNKKQIKRIQHYFELEAKNDSIHFTPVNTIVHEGFVDHDLRICCYTDHEIFDRYHKFTLRKSTTVAAKEAITLRELQDLQPGDYIVHVDHGIGRFAGLEKIEINGRMQEALKLVYKDGDVLYAGIHSLHRISKYRGKDGESPNIHKLGSGAWQRLKQKTRSRVKDIASELISLYAKRKFESGFTFSADTYLQEALEASFIYEDTPDQVKTTASVKKDMEAEMPMDRLICGDVGFGKTEIAIRAAFKAVADSKQVAILVPTTILALQHYKTFSERLQSFPCKVDYISRLKNAAKQKETLQNLQDGKTDIIIGTHRIVSKDVKFKNLGLLIVDEEQKFGVTVKEKLKALRVNVDTLTLTATPIPRTLQFSLMGVRDLSVITTPPPNRHPVITELHLFNEDMIRDAINYELSRNGQVFVINNRVQNIFDVQSLINSLVPKARCAVAHGQMPGQELEEIMLDYISGDYDVLIATSIIENGLDIPNANTIIIFNAHHFGLSDLHQLRGRVGRSNRKAFCYLIAPPIDTLPTDSRRRLKAIEDFAELGSGFNIALQDLDIRGAGDLLGGEQSGFIADIGFETYHRILDEAVLELKETEFKELFEKEKAESKKALLGKLELPQDHHFVNDCQIDTDLELLFPDVYIESISERMRLYRALDSMKNEKELADFETQLNDRFGEIPKQSKELLHVVRLRWLAIELGIERITLKQQKMTLYFVSNKNSLFYQSGIFTSILNYAQKNPKKCHFKESKEKLNLIFDNVKTLEKGLGALRDIIPAQIQ